MTIALVVAICIVLLILAFLAPRLSRYPQRGVQKTYSAGGNTAGKAPGQARPLAAQAVRQRQQVDRQERVGRSARARQGALLGRR